MASRGRVTPGQVYAARDEESGRYQILKVLHADDEVVVARRYSNLFTERPSEVPEGLRLDMTPEELERGEIGIGWGAIAIDADGFAAEAENFTLLGEETVTDEEHENVRDALSPPTHEGLFSRLTSRFRRRG